MDKQQMELGLGNGRVQRFPIRRVSRRTRARWWFERMRQVVDRAFDWEAAPGRAEQTWFPQANREIVLSAPRAKELQVCE